MNRGVSRPDVRCKNKKVDSPPTLFTIERRNPRPIWRYAGSSALADSPCTLGSTLLNTAQETVSHDILALRRCSSHCLPY